MTNPTTDQHTNPNFFIKLIAGTLHDTGFVDLKRLLEANRGCGNGIEEHILTCPMCQRNMKRKVAR